MNYNIEQIAKIVSGDLLLNGQNNLLTNIIYDSRKISFPETSIFIALKTTNNNGHFYIEDAYEKGIKNFIISQDIDSQRFKNCNFILVENTLISLQKLASYHRQQFDIPTIAITGSNGKTILKEWLHKALSQKFEVVQSPNSYNSQLGVALSLLQIDSHHDIAIIETAISQKDDMQKLEKIICPTIGILTNVGDAHSIGFEDINEKIQEKSLLFKNVSTLIYNSDSTLINNELNCIETNQKLNWGYNNDSKFKVKQLSKIENKTTIQITNDDLQYRFEIPFRNEEIIVLSIHFVICLLHFKYTQKEIELALGNIDLLPNRLQIKGGDYNSILINDSYSTDMASMQLALEYQDQYSKKLPKVIIFSDFDQQVNKEDIYNRLAFLFEQKNLVKIYAIGLDTEHEVIFEKLPIHFYKTRDELSIHLNQFPIKKSCILIKGARKFKLEILYEQLSLVFHQTTLETNFSALENNINVYRNHLNNSTKIMAVIKADAYGSGSVAVADFLTKKGIDYIAVALIDEAIKIRNSGCQLPIMVFNIHNDSLSKLWKYNLEPEVYSLSLFKIIAAFADTQKTILPIHLKVDSGMNRLGITKDKLVDVIPYLNSKNLKIKSIFSHLSASENDMYDSFTEQQFESYNEAYTILCQHLNYKPERHILNTSGIIRFPQMQYEMVRLGLGLYGIDETHKIKGQLQKVHTLKARILQIKQLEVGQTTGYSRSGKANQPIKIAIVSLGYADGLLRAAGNGNISVYLNGQKCLTIGNICMDVMMIDITHIKNVTVYDEVEIFGKQVSLQNIAKSCDTISYEIISRIAPRVKRVYTYE